LEKSGWIMGTDGIREKAETKSITTKQIVKQGNKNVTVNKTQTVTVGPATKLEFTLTTGNAPELKQAAELIKIQLEAIGIRVEIRSYETGQLNQLIRTRNYETLFFGQVVNQESDLFAFWHSSQRKDPGLNIAMYTNAKVDTLLEEAFLTTDEDERKEKYKKFVQEIQNDMATAFIYSPKLIYVTKGEVKNLELGKISSPSERFSDIYMWYIKTDRIWNFFSPKP